MTQKTQEEKRIFLIEYLLKENGEYENFKIPKDAQGQKDLLRSLMNVRLPLLISNEFLKIQDEYLKERNAQRGVMDVLDLQPVLSDSRLFIWQGDITTLKIDAIVNACNSKMLGCFSPLHSCIDNFIHTYAGVQLRLKMNEIMQKQGHNEITGTAKITSAYNLPSKHVLHTVGPIVQGQVTKKDEELLSSCYRECLALASKNKVRSIAFCCISTGVFCFPQKRAAQIAVKTVKDFLAHDNTIERVVFNVFKDEDFAIYDEILNA